MRGIPAPPLISLPPLSSILLELLQEIPPPPPPPPPPLSELSELSEPSSTLLPSARGTGELLQMPSSECLRRSQWLSTLTSRLPPQLRFLPYPAVRIIFLLVLANIIIWTIVAIVLRYNPALSSTALLSYTLGLRHALDADHISAIDLMTRRLIASGQKPVTVGTWFSLGHSTIVVITCIVVAATSGALEKRFDGFRNVGGIIGTSVSAAVLILLGVGNAWILWKLVGRMRAVLVEEDGADRRELEEGAVAGLNLEGGGLMVRMFKRVFKLIDRPWKMYPLGVLFGLGFDTSSEVAVLAIASIQGAKGTSIWLILIFPVLFTAGMCLLDTTDGALMMTLYTSSSMARDTIAILYYSIVLSAITVVVAIFIGTIQLLSLVANFSHGKFWDGVDAVGDHYDIVGGAICGAFVVTGALSTVCYGPWRRWVDRRPTLVAVELEPGGGNKQDNEKKDSIVVDEAIRI